MVNEARAEHRAQRRYDALACASSTNEIRFTKWLGRDVFPLSVLIENLALLFIERQSKQRAQENFPNFPSIRRESFFAERLLKQLRIVHRVEDRSLLRCFHRSPPPA